MTYQIVGDRFYEDGQVCAIRHGKIWTPVDPQPPDRSHPMKTLEITEPLRKKMDEYPRELIPLRLERNGTNVVVPVSRAFFEQHLAEDVMRYAQSFAERSAGV